MTEIGIVMEPVPKCSAEMAPLLEEMGFDIVLCPDTQNLSADPYGQLALMANATTSLKIGTGVTHPVTRETAVTASAMASLQEESQGRAICGIGRGDSSAAHIGKRQATTEELRSCVITLKRYLNGEAVEAGNTQSPIRWIDPKVISPVPIDIACTGPRTIEMACDAADRVSFAVGSAFERVEWAMNTAKEHLEKTGRSKDSLQIGAYINLICDHDEKRAISLARMLAGLVAHFTAMKGASTEHLPDKLLPVTQQLQTNYDMKNHSSEKGQHLDLIDDDFIEWFSIVGSPQKCIDSLGKLLDLGLDHIYILGGSPIAEPRDARVRAMVEQTEVFANEVLPVLK
ncbi:MAG: hypothetical protein CBE15_05455 [Euryarchaeota archaeon TMED255]|nr:MAG: hypothetical protein CBE15_05455 [Euryarchaeota archaeon TMED255]